MNFSCFASMIEEFMSNPVREVIIIVSVIIFIAATAAVDRLLRKGSGRFNKHPLE